ncbi:aromatic acid decarboxylase [Fibrobacterales bacterium]|nr:aromatic acid decarboxylase [Fibrobacterales bacterium]
MKTILLGITGASGMIYAKGFLELAKNSGIAVEAVVTKVGELVLRHEKCENILKLCKKVYAIDDFFAPPASGNSAFAGKGEGEGNGGRLSNADKALRNEGGYIGMVVLPCSMGTLGRIAAGTSDNLLVRAADVSLKENRTLVLVPREMPLNEIHLENMLKLKRAGAVILPASPHFYNEPKTIEDLADTVADRVLSIFSKNF